MAAEDQPARIPLMKQSGEDYLFADDESCKKVANGWKERAGLCKGRKDLQGLQVFKEGLCVKVDAMHELCKDSCARFCKARFVQ